MDALQFCYWLTGFTEITNGQVPDATQWEVILDHLALARGTPRTLIEAGPNEFGPQGTLTIDEMRGSFGGPHDTYLIC